MKKKPYSSMNKPGSLFAIFLVVLIDLIGFGIVLPLMPFFATHFEASPIEIGLLFTAYSAMQFIAAPIWGHWSDKVGRRPVMLVSTAASSLSYVIFAFAPNYGVLLASRLLAGLMGGNISAAQAAIADVTDDSNRTKGMGVLGAAFGLGFVLGPALTTLILYLPFSFVNEYALPGLAAALLSFISFLLVLTRMPETRNITEKSLASLRNTRGLLFEYLSGRASDKLSPKLKKLLLPSSFLLSFSQASLYAAFPLLCHQTFGMTSRGVGALYIWMGFVAVLVQGGLIRFFVKKWHEVHLFTFGNIALILGLILLPLANSVGVLVFYLTLMGIGSSLNVPTLNSLISKEAEDHERGAILGASQGMSGLGRVVGPTWGGFLLPIAATLPFHATAGVAAFTLWVSLQLKKGSNE